MNKTVYLISRGSYSDYSVMGIYSTREKAEEASKVQACDNDIEEFTLDYIPDYPPGKLKYRVYMKFNGDNAVSDQMNVSDIGYEWMHYIHDKLFSFTVWAEDEKAAIKIANEKRIQLLAANMDKITREEMHQMMVRGDIKRI